jgi:hypothetical protein
MLRMGRDERSLALVELELRSLHLERARAFEDDIDLVVLVRLLAVWLGRDEHVDADLEARRLVHDLVAPAGGGEPALRLRDVEALLGPQTAAFRNSGMISSP